MDGARRQLPGDPSDAFLASAAFASDYVVTALGASAGGSGTFFQLNVVRNGAGAIRIGPPYEIGDNTGPGITIDGQTVHVRVRTFRPGDPHCCPMWPMAVDFVVDGDSLRLVATSPEPPGGGISGVLPGTSRPLPATLPQPAD